MNAKMPELNRCFEAAGFTDVKTLLSSGNVVFRSTSGSAASLERKIEGAMEKELGHSFLTIIRSIGALHDLLASDPYKRTRLPPRAKRVVTFLRKKPKTRVTLPPEVDGARILCVQGMEVFSFYVPSPKGPAFMRLIEKTFGAEVTTRTWETVTKVAG